MEKALCIIVEKDTYFTAKTPSKCYRLAGQEVNDSILHVFVMARGLCQTPPGAVSQVTLGLYGIWNKQAF